LLLRKQAFFGDEWAGLRCHNPHGAEKAQKGITNDQEAGVGRSPTPQTGFVTAILSKPETICLAWGMAFLTADKDKEIS
jgi:hypothetical protein